MEGLDGTEDEGELVDGSNAGTLSLVELEVVALSSLVAECAMVALD